MHFEQPHGKSGRRSSLIIGGAGVFLFLVGGALALSYLLFQPVSLRAVRTITVEDGDTAGDLAHRLKQENLIKSALAFRALYSFVYPGATVKAGKYELSGSPSLVQTALLFMRGVPDNEKTITIIEGWTIEDIARYLEHEHGIPRAAFRMAAQKNYTYAYPFLTSSTSVEGYLFPDTYRIFEESSAEEVIGKMLDNFGKKYSADMVAETLRQGRTIQSVVTLASILEREVVGEKDRRIVADIFYRRLAKGMPLQADSTINFITGKKDAQARLIDLEIDSPYNTYTHKGLPPGPIGNPGLSALQAALSPIENPFWFFLTTLEGEVIYSKTFEEHVKNKLKYLKK